MLRGASREYGGTGTVIGTPPPAAAHTVIPLTPEAGLIATFAPLSACVAAAIEISYAGVAAPPLAHTVWCVMTEVRWYKYCY